MVSVGLAALVLAVAVPLVLPAGSRQRIRFDDAWKVFRNPDDHATSGFQWSWKLAKATSLNIGQLPADWNEGNWEPTRPGQFQIRTPNTFAWFKAELGNDPKDQANILRFGGVDDACVVFLNGKMLVAHRGWNEPFETPVASAWKDEGPNEVVLLVENENSQGGLMGSVRLEPPESDEAPKQAEPSFDDSSWRTVDLPHDYVVEGTFDPDQDTGHGSLPTPTAWYRKTFEAPEGSQGRIVYLEFDGIFRNSKIWLNGHLLGHHKSGYIGVRYDVTPFLHHDKPNHLSVLVDPRMFEGWWYEGGGIYRHVWLTVVDPVHVKPDGVFVKATPDGDVPEPLGTATITIETDVANRSDAQRPFELRSEIVDPDGKSIADLGNEGEPLAPGSERKLRHTIRIGGAKLWSVEKPELYKLRTKLLSEGEVVDSVETAFGIRSIRFDKDLGFFLNGRPVKLKGTCNHQDHAGVGIALPDSLMEWRIRKLKEMGSNAYRCAHNPPALELLDACDRLGMLVMDETRHLGDTSLSKSPSGTKADQLTELRTMLLRDRNHPSVIMWSLFNEEPLQGTEEGATIFAAMKKLCDELDGTRPTTGAVNFGFGEGVVKVADVYGFNYSIGQYDPIRAKFPNLPLIATETASTVGSRGVYANDKEKGYVSAYDVNHPTWGNTAEEAWKAVVDRPWMSGTFVWTGFDYKGEPTPYGWPCINSHFGILDICGFPKDNFWYYKAWWGEEPLVHILPHWSWPGKEGQEIDVWCHSNADEVELFLNGTSLGKKAMPRNGHLEWKVPYSAGRLEAKGYRAGQVIAEDRVETSGPPAGIALSLEFGLSFRPGDAYPIRVAIVDAQGRTVPTADNLVTFEVTGSGTLLGVGNGDPSSHEPDKADRRRAFNGLCMAMLQAKQEPGPMTLIARSPGLTEARLVFQITN